MSSRKKMIDSFLEALDPGSEAFKELKEIIDEEIDMLKDMKMMGGMAGSNMVRPTNNQVRKFARGGALMGQMRARDNRADMEAGGMVSRGGRMSRQGIKFKGVK